MPNELKANGTSISGSMRGSLESMRLGALPMRQFGQAINWSNSLKYVRTEYKPWVELPQAQQPHHDASASSIGTNETAYDQDPVSQVSGSDLTPAVVFGSTESKATAESTDTTEGIRASLDAQPKAVVDSVSDEGTTATGSLTTKNTVAEEPTMRATEVSASELVSQSSAMPASDERDMKPLRRDSQGRKAMSPPREAVKSKANMLSPESKTMPTDEYLAKLEQLVLELNLELCNRNDHEQPADPLERMSQRIIALNLENLALKERLSKTHASS